MGLAYSYSSAPGTGYCNLNTQVMSEPLPSQKKNHQNDNYIKHTNKQTILKQQKAGRALPSEGVTEGAISSSGKCQLLDRGQCFTLHMAESSEVSSPLLGSSSHASFLVGNDE